MGNEETIGNPDYVTLGLRGWANAIIRRIESYPAIRGIAGCDSAHLTVSFTGVCSTEGTLLD